MPPTKLKPRSSGRSKPIGQPVAISAMSGGDDQERQASSRPAASAARCGPAGASPKLLSASVARHARGKRRDDTSQLPSPATGAGTMRPRLLRKISPNSEMLWRGRGSVPSTARYQNRI